MEKYVDLLKKLLPKEIEDIFSGIEMNRIYKAKMLFGWNTEKYGEICLEEVEKWLEKEMLEKDILPCENIKEIFGDKMGGCVNCFYFEQCPKVEEKNTTSINVDKVLKELKEEFKSCLNMEEKQEKQEETAELKPCPFCGDTPMLKEIKTQTHSIARFKSECLGLTYINCTTCACKIYGKTKNEAVNNWNARIEKPIVDTKEIGKACVEGLKNGLNLDGAKFNQAIERCDDNLSKIKPTLKMNLDLTKEHSFSGIVKNIFQIFPDLNNLESFEKELKKILVNNFFNLEKMVNIRFEPIKILDIDSEFEKTITSNNFYNVSINFKINTEN